MINKQSIEAIEDPWQIPCWVKVAITILACSIGVAFVLTVSNGQGTFLSLSTGPRTFALLVLALIPLIVAAAFWLRPDHSLSLSIYWLIGALRQLICVFALLGMVTLYTVGIPIYSRIGSILFSSFFVSLGIGLFVLPTSPVPARLSGIRRLLGFKEKFSSTINSLSPSILGVIVALLPILIILLVIYAGLGASLAEYGPYSFWNDETGYWIWIRSFSHAGLDAGYNAPNELIAPAGFNHYGEGSPFFIYFYGAIAQLTGWYSYIPLLINFALLAFSILVFVRSTKLDSIQIIFVGLITVLVWPVLLYLPITSHETMNQAIGFLLAVVFFRLLARHGQVRLPEKILYVLLIYFAALIRLSWGLLLVPALFYALRGSAFRRLLLSLLCGAGLYMSAVLITSYLVPPANNSILLNLTGSLTEGPQILLDYIATQFRLMFKFRELNPNIAVMFQIVVILGWGFVRLVRMIQAKMPISAILQSPAVFSIYNAASLAVAGLLFYIQEGFYRTFTPSLLLVYLLLTTRRDYRFLTALLVVNLVFFHSYMTFYAHVGDAQIVRADFTTEFPERAALQAEMEKQIVYDETTRNPWCNTLLIPLHLYDYRLTVVPPGIGISYILDADTLQTPVQSKYLLFDRDTYEVFAPRLNASLVSSLSIGELYYNHDSGCEFNP
jgi:hypothetical protein